MVEVVTEEQRRILAFVATANEGGYEPSTHEIEAWLRHPVPQERWSAMLGTATTLALYGFRETESPVRQLSSIGWITDWGDKHSLTQLGAAMLRGSEHAQSEEVQVAVLGRGDPLAYPRLIGHLAEIGDALLVDPYLEVSGATDLISHTDISRVLVSDAAGTKGKRAALATLLATELGDHFEVRSAPGLHDRFVVSEGGEVWTIGASLNGVGRRATTVVTPLPPSAASVVASEMNQAWADAESLISRSTADADVSSETVDRP